jgi:cobalamin biosynthetic protein CobC
MATAAQLAVFRRHGGRLAAARAAFPDAPSPWLDLSTGINPRPYPAPRAARGDLGRLPDPERLGRVEALAAAAFGAIPGRVAAVPGSEAAIRLLPRLLAAPTVAIGHPTYSSHADAWRAAGAQVVAEAADAEALAAVNPNNPDGRTTPRAELLASAQRRWTVVDEAFADTDPALSVAGEAGGRLIVLRSFGKFYGLPGLRLGFVIAAPKLLAGVRAAFGDWPVSADALAAAEAAYADKDWSAQARARLAADARRLDALLTAAGLKIVGGTSLFRLAETPDAAALFVHLAQAGILCRPFDDPRRLRFGLPGSPAAWARLKAALSQAHP